MTRKVVIESCIVEGCKEQGSWGLFNRYACYQHRHLLERRPETSAPPVKSKKDAPIGDLFDKRD